MKKIIGAIAVWAVMAIGAQAQLSLDDIEAALDGAAGELQRVDEILAHPDANRRLAGMELLLNSGNPTFTRRAKEVGLFSSDSYLRSAALKAVLDGGSSLTFELDTSGLEAELRSKWVEGFDGDGAVAPDGSKISLTFRVGAYDPKEKCYLTHSGKSCLLLLEGENVALYWGFYNTMNGLTRLNQAGELEGVISYMDYGNDRGAVPVRVNLMN